MTTHEIKRRATSVPFLGRRYTITCTECGVLSGERPVNSDLAATYADKHRRAYQEEVAG